MDVKLGYDVNRKNAYVARPSKEPGCRQQTSTLCIGCRTALFWFHVPLRCMGCKTGHHLLGDWLRYAGLDLWVLDVKAPDPAALLFACSIPRSEDPDL